MNLFDVMDISGSALLAERQRAEIVTSNLANAETTHTAEGGPYRRMEVVFRAYRETQKFATALASVSDLHARGVRVEGVVEDNTAPLRRYEPNHPDADDRGYVSYPAVNAAEEMVNLIGAARSYELNAAAVQATKAMITAAIAILS